MSKMLKVVGASWLRTKVSSYILAILGVIAILLLFIGLMERTQEDGTFTATVFYSNKIGYSIEFWGQSNELQSIQKGVARAYFRMDMANTGWSVLEVETDGSYPDDVQAYAAGIVEGALTWYPIHTHLENTIRSVCKDQEKLCDKLHDVLERSVNIWKAYAAEHADEDPFWHQVSLYYSQIRGVFTGWKHGVERSQTEHETDISDLYWLNALADVKEIQRKLNISLETDDLSDLPSFSAAFLRLIDEESEDGQSARKLFVAHNTAGSYTSMTRMLKRYKLNYHQTAEEGSPSIPGTSVEFSGYPGSITSQDEFYSVQGVHHKLAITGTPLNNYNERLWKDVNVTEQLPVGPRITAANHLATNVSSWVHTMARSNSGTACKQWLVADFAHIDKHREDSHAENLATASKDDVVTEIVISGRNKDVKHTVVHRNSAKSGVKDLLWLLEQIPGRTHSADLSDVFLEQRYWATYGLPFFKNIADLTKIKQMEDKYGSIFSEKDSPRGRTFKEEHLNATTQERIIKLMRQNNLTELLKHEADEDDDDIEQLANEKLWAILGIRWDIIQKHKLPYGVIDTKVISGTTNRSSNNFVAVSGPPYTISSRNKTDQTQINKGNVAPIYVGKPSTKPITSRMEIGNLVKHKTKHAPEEFIPPFQWSKSEYKDESHEGLPDTWAFEPFTPKWSW